MFKCFHERSINDYVEHGILFNEAKNIYELAFSAEIEYDIYCASPDIYPYNSSIETPIYIIYSNEIASTGDLNWYKNKFKEIELIAFNAGHLFPFEQPEKTAELINSIINK